MRHLVLFLEIELGFDLGGDIEYFPDLLVDGLELLFFDVVGFFGVLFDEDEEFEAFVGGELGGDVFEKFDDFVVVEGEFGEGIVLEGEGFLGG